MDEIQRQIKRQSYWIRDGDYIPPKKIVKRPKELTLDELILTKKTIKIEQ